MLGAMNDGDTDQVVGSSQLFWDMIRAVFVTGQILLFLFIGTVTIGSTEIASSPPTPDFVDTVVPHLGFDDVVVFAIGAIAALAGTIISVRPWLRSSWHVVTVAMVTTLCTIAFAYGFVLRNFP